MDSIGAETLNGKTPRIVLATPGHLGTNPRLVKEANTLADEGYETHVISCDYDPNVRSRDALIRKGAKWSWTCLPVVEPRWRYRLNRVRQELAIAAFRGGARSVAVAVLAHHPAARQLIQAVRRERADLYIGHCLAALPAVVAAARRHGALAGFDAEDYHAGEQDESNPRRALANRIAKRIEDEYLPQCVYFTAASPLIADAYAERFGRRPEPILNVFPLAECPDDGWANPVHAGDEADGQLRFYWFSQTVGPGRGLEEFIGLAAALARPVRLDLRGQVTETYQQKMQQLAGSSDRVTLRFLPPAPAGDMVRLAAGYTAGLSLEQRTPPNRDLCLTNKAFTYLLAGTPVILSRTRAQELLAAELGDAALLIDLDDQATAAATMFSWCGDGARVREAKSRAWQLGRERFNWDVERQKLIDGVDRVLGHRAGQPMTAAIQGQGAVTAAESWD